MYYVIKSIISVFFLLLKVRFKTLCFFYVLPLECTNDKLRTSGKNSQRIEYRFCVSGLILK